MGGIKEENHQKLLSKYQGKIQMQKLDNTLQTSQHVMNEFKDKIFKESVKRIRVKDKECRATVKQVLDPRTRVILVKMLNMKFIRKINDFLSTGKEANVYHAY